MIRLELEVDDEQMTFMVPSGWDEVSLDVFTKINAIDRPAEMSDLTYSIKVLAAITGVSADIISIMDYESFKTLAELIEFTNEDIKSSNKEFIELNGEQYFLKKDFDKMNVGEIASFEVLLEKANNKVVDIMPEMLCIFLRKKKENGKLEAFKADMMDRKELFSTVSVADVNDLFIFFSDGGSL